jgi:hypothetical protein
MFIAAELPRQAILRVQADGHSTKEPRTWCRICVVCRSGGMWNP